MLTTCPLRAYPPLTLLVLCVRAFPRLWLLVVQELLGFYRQKIAEFDGEHADMLAKLERYKVTFADQHKVC